VLGPTNTGKTHRAIERMLQHRSGAIGLPLRLLAREVHDRIRSRRGANAVALVTGEEKILPPGARYRVCTTEALPSRPGADFVCVDEVQMAADPERGHVVTDRLLHARGFRETWFLGSASMEGRIREMLPDIRVTGRQRMSKLSFGGRARLDSLPPRTAIIAFSAAEVYEIAAVVRQRRGGAAVVLGALSPRARNAQVELFQSGEVDTLVATDAIGMGMNLDIDTVAFTRLSKFDGERMRLLRPDEIGQIAGRAGRHRRPGSFVLVGDSEDMPPGVARAVEEQRFPPVRHLRWRNPAPDFANLQSLLDSLTVRPSGKGLAAPREGSDLRALRILMEDPFVRERAVRPEPVRLLWQACQIPDYRGDAAAGHAALVRDIFRALTSRKAALSGEWMASALSRIDTASDHIATLSSSLERARTCQYIAHQASWLEDPEEWRPRTGAVENCISDRLHQLLVAKFVDVRATRMARLARQGRKPVASIDDSGSVHVEGACVGRLEGFRFKAEPSESGRPVTDVESRARALAVRSALSERVGAFLKSPPAEMSVEGGRMLWRGHAIADLARGDAPLRPRLRLRMDDFADAEDRSRTQARALNGLDEQLRGELAPLFALRTDETLSPAARAIAYRIAGSHGILRRSSAADEIQALAPEERNALRRHGIRFGSRYVFVRALLKPAATRLRLELWRLEAEPARCPEPPPPSRITVSANPAASDEFLRVCGFHRCGKLALRIDMLERLLNLIWETKRSEAARKAGGWFLATPDMLSITGTSAEEFREILHGLGFESEVHEPEPDLSAANPADMGLRPSGEGRPRRASAEAGTVMHGPAAGEDAQARTAAPEPGPPAGAPPLPADREGKGRTPGPEGTVSGADAFADGGSPAEARMPPDRPELTDADREAALAGVETASFLAMRTTSPAPSAPEEPTHPELPEAAFGSGTAATIVPATPPAADEAVDRKTERRTPQAVTEQETVRSQWMEDEARRPPAAAEGSVDRKADRLDQQAVAGQEAARGHGADDSARHPPPPGKDDASPLAATADAASPSDRAICNAETAPDGSPAGTGTPTGRGPSDPPVATARYRYRLRPRSAKARNRSDEKRGDGKRPNSSSAAAESGRPAVRKRNRQPADRSPAEGAAARPAPPGGRAGKRRPGPQAPKANPRPPRERQEAWRAKTDARGSRKPAYDPSSPFAVLAKLRLGNKAERPPEPTEGQDPPSA